jgi:hypothetical protein
MLDLEKEKVRPTTWEDDESKCTPSTLQEGRPAISTVICLHTFLKLLLPSPWGCSG